jgi:hypothetical protein
LGLVCRDRILFMGKRQVLSNIWYLKKDIARHCIIFLMSYIEEFEDAKGVIRIRISKNRQHNGQKKNTNDKQRSTKHTHKNKDRVTRTPIKTGGEDRCSGRISSSCPTTYPFLHIKKTYFIELTP